MGDEAETARTLEMLESSEDRLNSHLDQLFKKPEVVAILTRDQNPAHDHDDGDEPKAACG